jgi:hypothetical protein
MLIRPSLIFACSSPGGGPTFEAAMVEIGGRLRVLSTRHGRRLAEPFITPADLLMAEQELVAREFIGAGFPGHVARFGETL